MAEHQIAVIKVSYRGYCHVCKKVIEASRAFSNKAQDQNFVRDSSLISFMAYDELSTHQCPGPAMEVPRSYDGVIEMQPKAGSS